MAEAPPKLGDIPQQSAFSVPTLSGTSTSTAPKYDNEMSSKRTSIGGSQTKAAAYNADYSTTQNLADSLNNAPIAQAVKNQGSKTAEEFQNLANSRTTPEHRTATDQPLTHYHSLFYELLSWENPRVSALSYVAIVTLIFVTRYLPILPIALKLTYYALGVTALAEIVGKAAFSQGLASSFRPKQYYTIPRETLEAMTEDVEEFINFFVIESQRILFAENVFHTVAAFLASFAGWLLVKFVPFWGLSLIGVSVLYITPLVYITNKEIIDAQIANVQDLANSQASQVKELAGVHTAKATENLQSLASTYTGKAQDMMGRKSEAGTPTTPVKGTDFPPAPKRSPSSQKKVAQRA